MELSVVVVQQSEVSTRWWWYRVGGPADRRPPARHKCVADAAPLPSFLPPFLPSANWLLP